MHYIAPCFAFNLAQIGALLCGWAAHQRLAFLSATSGAVAAGFAVAACVMAWNL